MNKKNTFFYRIRRGLFQITRSLFKQKCILLESAPCYSDSVKRICDEFILRGLNNKYEIVWLNFDNSDVPNEYEGVCRSIYPRKNKLLYWYYQLKAQIVICSNLFVDVPGMGKQGSVHSFYISHGSHIKSTHSYYNIPTDFDFLISASNDLKDIQAFESNYPIERVMGLGLPRNDDLFDSKVNINEIFGTNNSKFIVWYPTYRQGKNGGISLAGDACPLIHNAEIAEKVNEYSKNNNIYLVLKPHFVQDISFIKDCKLSNIIIIDDSFYKRYNISSYQFVGACDALLTDYSSIMYDFTLCDKPIGLIWEDVEEYRKNPGFANNIDEYLECTHKIYDFDDMKKFIDVVKNGTDSLEETRKRVKAIVNNSIQPDNTQRVVDFILRKADF